MRHTEQPCPFTPLLYFDLRGTVTISTQLHIQTVPSHVIEQFRILQSSSLSLYIYLYWSMYYDYGLC